jgi:hypothetical protein
MESTIRDAVQRVHRCSARFIESTVVTAQSDHYSWTGEVQSFEIVNQAGSTKCYAWKDASEHYQTVLHMGVIDTATKAVEYILNGQMSKFEGRN